MSFNLNAHDKHRCHERLGLTIVILKSGVFCRIGKRQRPPDFAGVKKKLIVSSSTPSGCIC